MATPTCSGSRSSLYGEKLDLVLTAGACVIARRGYGQATIRQVAAEAGMSLAGLYHYVSSKEELLFRIQFHTFEAILDRLKQQLDGVRDPVERLRVMVLNHLEHFLSRMDDLKVCARELDSLGGEHYERVRALRQRYLKVTLEIVESLGKCAERPKIPPRLATLYLFGMVNWIHMWYPAEEGELSATLADQVVTLFLEGYLPRRTGDAHAGMED